MDMRHYSTAESRTILQLFEIGLDKKSNMQALARWALRNALSSKVGRGRYAMAEYEKLKRITIPLDDNSHLLLVSTEVDADHDRIIDKILKSIQHSSDD